MKKRKPPLQLIVQTNSKIRTTLDKWVLLRVSKSQGKTKVPEKRPRPLNFINWITQFREKKSLLSFLFLRSIRTIWLCSSHCLVTLDQNFLDKKKRSKLVGMWNFPTETIDSYWNFVAAWHSLPMPQRVQQ